MLNHAPLKRPGLRNADMKEVFSTPLEVFTGYLPKRPLPWALPISCFQDARTEDEAQAGRLAERDRLKEESLQEMHENEAGVVTTSRKTRMQKHNERNETQSAQCSVDDFALVRHAVQGKHKLHFSWC